MKIHYFWSAVRQWGQRLGSALTFVILARMLPPGEIGLFSAALAIIAFAEILNETGAGEAVIRHREASAGAIKALNIANVLASLLLAGSFLVFAKAIEGYFGTPGLAAVVRVLALVLLANAFVYVPMAMMRRDMEFAALARISLMGTALGFAVGIGLAFAGAGVWALVAQALSFALSNLVLYRSRLRGRLGGPADFRSARPLFVFGGYVLLGNLLAYASNRVVELALPYHYGAATLALYIVGSRFYFVAAQMISAVVLDVTSIRLAHLQDDRENFSAELLASSERAAFVAGPIFFGLAAIAPEFCRFVFGRTGELAWPYLTVTALGGNALLQLFLMQAALKTSGRSGLNAALSTIQAAGVLIVLLPAWPITPICRVVLVNAIGFVAFLLTAANVKALNLSSKAKMFRRVFALWAVGLIMAGAIFLLREQFANIPDFVALVLFVALGALTYLPLAFLMSSSQLRSDIVVVGLKIRRR